MIATVSGMRSEISEPSPLCCQVDRAAERLDRALDHIHADPAAGQVRHLLRRREAGMEDELEQIMLADLLPGLDETRRLSLGTNLLMVDAAAVIGYLNNDFAMRPDARKASPGRCAACQQLHAPPEAQARGRSSSAPDGPADPPAFRSLSCRLQCFRRR